MTTAEIGKALVDLCRQGKYMDVISKYYSDDIVSVGIYQRAGHAAGCEGY